MYDQDGPTSSEDPEAGAYGILSDIARQAAKFANDVHRKVLEDLFAKHELNVDLSDDKIASLTSTLRNMGYVLVSEKDGNDYTLILAQVVDVKKYRIALNFKFDSPEVS